MSDAEEELLLLAGGDVSSDDDRSYASRNGSEAPARAPKKESSAKGGVKASRDADESEEEGEASPPGSPDSQGSAAMDESDSDDDSPQQTKSGRGAPGGDDDLNKYPVDGLFVSHAEKAEIMNMREIEKEQKIAERREEIERIRQNLMLRQLVNNNHQDNKKRKAAAADLDYERPSKTSRSARGAKGDEPASKIDSLRKAREERKDRIQQRERESERDRNKRRSPSYGRRSNSRDSRDDGSDVEWADDKKRRSRTPEKKETPEADLRDVERIRVGRSRFAEVCFYPGFDEAITGCYVRINIGPDRENPAAGDIYRMAIIKGFAKGKAYAMPNRQGKQIVVETYVKAAHGKAQREWPFIACSDRPFTEAEFNRYKSVCAAESIVIPKRPSFVKKIDDINALVSRHWTESELAEKLTKQNALKIKYSNMQRERVVKLLEEARSRGDEERAASLQEELDGMETHRLAFRTSLTPATTKSASNSNGNTPSKREGPSQQDRLALLNLENRRKNAEAVRQAQLKERAKAREMERKAQQAAAAAAAAAANPGDSPPKDTVPATDQELAERIRKLQREREEREKGGRRGGVPTIHKPLMDDDIIGALDLGIDLDIEL